jgi:pimeloyl-ACP methyl ester carboxylesterase
MRDKRKGITCGLALAVLMPVAALWAQPVLAQSEQVIEVATRGQKMRALLLTPANPIGSVILLAGGHGNLALGKDGRIGWGAGNQLVRTRAGYAKAGFVTAVPDVAPDLKQGDGVVAQSRWSDKFARDIGALVKHLRGLKEPVYLVGTSRATLTVAKAGVTLTSAEAPDAIVITAGMLVHITDKQPSAERNVGNLGRIKQPTFIVYHEKDGCAYTPASSAPRGKALLTSAKKVDVKILTGGSAGSGDPCEANSHHGFLGQDAEVVQVVTGWLKELKGP